MKFLLLASALLLPVTGALAQVVGQLDEAGHTTHTNQPDPALPQAVVPEQRSEVSVPRTVRPRIASKRAAEINAKEAERRLEQAQLKRSEGAEPLPGERGQVNGGSVPNYRYWKRQEQLRVAVEQAQRRWNQTHRIHGGQAQPLHASGMQLVRQER